jgi:hypothetical protein
VKRSWQVALVCSALGATYAFAQYQSMAPLTGEFDITGRTPVDPSPQERRDTHLRLHLTGRVARTLYDHMQVEAGPNRCGPRTDRREKRIGDTLCSTDGRTYECFLAINIQEQTVQGGWAC